MWIRRLIRICKWTCEKIASISKNKNYQRINSFIKFLKLYFTIIMKNVDLEKMQK